MERSQPHTDSPPALESLATDTPSLAESDALAEAPPGVLAKLGRVIPGADALVRFAYRTGAASAVAAALIWVALFGRVVATPAMPWGLGLGIAVVLFVPALAAALVGWTLADLVRLPGQLRQAAVAAASSAGGVVTAKGSRIAAIFRALWAARGLALGSKEAWLRAIAAARFVRLASLPFMVALVGLFALNGAVILGGLVALVALVT